MTRDELAAARPLIRLIYRLSMPLQAKEMLYKAFQAMPENDTVLRVEAHLMTVIRRLLKMEARERRARVRFGQCPQSMKAKRTVLKAKLDEALEWTKHYSEQVKNVLVALATLVAALQLRAQVPVGGVVSTPLTEALKIPPMNLNIEGGAPISA